LGGIPSGSGVVGTTVRGTTVGGTSVGRGGARLHAQQLKRLYLQQRYANSSRENFIIFFLKILVF
jgi:hypothetical protein